MNIAFYAGKLLGEDGVIGLKYAFGRFYKVGPLVNVLNYYSIHYLSAV